MAMLDNVVNVAMTVNLVVLGVTAADDVALGSAERLGFVVAVALAQFHLVRPARHGELETAGAVGQGAERARVGAGRLAVMPDHPVVSLARDFCWWIRQFSMPVLGEGFVGFPCFPEDGFYVRICWPNPTGGMSRDSRTGDAAAVAARMEAKPNDAFIVSESVVEDFCN